MDQLIFKNLNNTNFDYNFEPLHLTDAIEHYGGNEEGEEAGDEEERDSEATT